jgi:dihydropteroate synthase
LESSRVSEKNVLTICQNHIKNGSDILDIGAFSTRPGATEVSEKEEITRLIPILQLIRKEFSETLISVDTFRKNVAQEALSVGADIINDVSSARIDSQMLDFICHNKVPYIFMHSRGDIQTGKDLTNYQDLIGDVLNESESVLEKLRKADIFTIFDPGFGFSKTLEQNFELMNRLSEFSTLDLPVLVGISRKSMIWKSLNINAEQALNGTTFLHAIALKNGAKILRVHDSKEAKECIELYKKLNFS